MPVRYISLHHGFPEDGNYMVNEVSYPGYARQPLEETVTFAPFLPDEGDEGPIFVAYYGVCDKPDGYSGDCHLLAHEALDRQLNPGDVLTITIKLRN
jgi:hypothetical protein